MVEIVLAPDVTVNVAVFSPRVSYVLSTDADDPDTPSLPVHAYVYDPVPPVTADDHDTGCNTVTGEGFAEHVTVKMFTVSVSESVAVPPAPVHDNEYVVVVDGLTVTEPDVAFPVEKLVPVQDVAFADDHVSIAD